MKKKFIKFVLVAMFVTGGMLTAKQLRADGEGTGSWNPVSVAIGYIDQFGVFHQTGSKICCGAGVTGCTPQGC